MQPVRQDAPSARLRPSFVRHLKRAFQGAVVLGLASLLTGAVVPAPSSDVASDSVGATKGTFGVSETGAATYSLPIFVTPGVAGMAPQVSLEYDSQGGDGPLGKGWSLNATSSISRCRAARETADFAGDNQPVNRGGPVTMTDADKLCLDGQRLVPANVPAGTPSCEALSGATATEYRTEIESNQRVCAYQFAATRGPRFFTVERADGGTSWYGDRRETAGDHDDAGASGALRADSVATHTLRTWNGSAYVHTENGHFTWAQTRRMDASGNYVDYFYEDHAEELYLGRIEYTGKKNLPGQAAGDRTPTSYVLFAYVDKQQNAWTGYYVQGQYVQQRRALSTITVLEGGGTQAHHVRHYQLGYHNGDYSGIGHHLTSVRECADSSAAVCYPATQFSWSDRSYNLGAPEAMTPPDFRSLNDFDGYKLGDVDGDGLQDMVRLYDDNCGDNEQIIVAFAQVDAAGKVALVEPAQAKVCAHRNLVGGSLGDKGNSWFLFDYDGDGRDDILAPTNDSYGYQLLRSQGRPASATSAVFAGTALVSGLMPKPGSSEDLLQLADLNGDGLLDVFYKLNDAPMVRLMARNGSSYGWGAARAATFETNCAVPQFACTLKTPDVVKTNGGVHMYDFNGDSRSELLFRNKRDCRTGCERDTEGLEAYGVTSIDGSLVTFGYMGGIDTTNYHTSDRPVYASINHRFGDFNGDGLTDVLYEGPASENFTGALAGDWRYALNSGKGTFPSPYLIDSYDYDRGYSARRLHILDVNGDGRDDIVHVNRDGMNVRHGNADGTFSHLLVAIDQSQVSCGESLCEDRYSPLFGDFDGDGGLDLLRIQWKNANNNDDLKMNLFRSSPDKRYLPRDAIVAVTDGLGARTDVTYLPLTLKDLYRRDLGSRNAMQIGRGSPVQDVIAPMYVVSSVRTDAPSLLDVNGKRTVHYRYAGAKMQAGGRGFLGFREVTSIDTSYPGKHVATTTTYRQDFPFIGRPLSQSTVIVDGDYLPGACNSRATPTTPFPSACFAAMSGAFAPIAGITVSRTDYLWTSPNFVAATQLGSAPTQIPVRVQLEGTVAEAFDPTPVVPKIFPPPPPPQVLLSRVSSSFVYDAWGNATTATVMTETGEGDTTPSTKTTTSTYSNDQAKWHIGRLATASVAHARAGLPTITRRTAFAYHANTGLLTSERIEPFGDASRDLRTMYDLDDFGNRVAAYTCSQDLSDAACKSRTTVVNWTATTQLQRYTFRKFDARGRYLAEAWEPFRKSGTGFGTGEHVDVKVQQVDGVDKFGNVVHTIDRNGLHVTTGHGAMGRPYWSWTQTVEGAIAGDPNGGIDSYTTYRTCAQVHCPTGAAYRVRVVTEGQPAGFTYFDKLGRSVMTASQAHNVGVDGMNVAATCTWYDAAGRTAGVSNPFFLPGNATGSNPTFAASICDATQRDGTYTSYDVVGRPTRVVQPDASQSTMEYRGLTATTTDALGHSRSEVKDALGQLTSTTDHDGLQTRYEYDATGNLTRVMRDAGRGIITTRMTYDLLGRRTQLVDPDAGTRAYTFNAMGEQLSESGGQVLVAKRYDFKGRAIWEASRSLAEGVTGDEWQVTRTYDTADNGLGQLAGSATVGRYYAYSGQPGADLGLSHTIGIDYDSLGRPLAKATHVDGVEYTEQTRYDALGRPFKQQDATGRWLMTQYTARGTFLRTCETTEADTAVTCAAGSASTYYDRMQVNERGDILVDRRGGKTAMTGRRTYDPQTGALKTICIGADTGGCQIVNDTYTWDDAGNLLSRENVSFREHFEYDGLNRLARATYSKWNGVDYGVGTVHAVALELRYDLLGNICNRLEGGSNYAYHYGGAAGCGIGGLPGGGVTGSAASPHAVTKLVRDGKVFDTYQYDLHGNQVSTPAGGRTIKYSTMDQAHEVTRGTRSSRFWYGEGGVRYKREDITIASPGNSVTRTIQVGNVEIVTGPSGALKRRHIAGVMYQQLTLNAQGVEVATNYYTHQDHLGNIVAVSNSAGAVQERLGYSALGNRISLTTLGATATASLTRKGFTGHDQFELLNIVHMNGRIYDPTLGRFLQPDPVVQDPANGQNYNRYTYVWNNPLAYTDPTGMISVKNLFRQIVGIYVSAYLGSSTNLFGGMAGSTSAKAFGNLVGSYIAGGKNNLSLSAAYDFGRASSPVISAESAGDDGEGREVVTSTALRTQTFRLAALGSNVPSCGRDKSYDQALSTKGQAAEFSHEIIATPAQVARILESRKQFYAGNRMRETFVGGRQTEPALWITGGGTGAFAPVRCLCASGDVMEFAERDDGINVHGHYDQKGNEVPGVGDFIRRGGAFPRALHTSGGRTIVIEVREVLPGRFEQRARVIFGGTPESNQILEDSWRAGMTDVQRYSIEERMNARE